MNHYEIVIICLSLLLAFFFCFNLVLTHEIVKLKRQPAPPIKEVPKTFPIHIKNTNYEYQIIEYDYTIIYSEEIEFDNEIQDYVFRGYEVFQPMTTEVVEKNMKEGSEPYVMCYLLMRKPKK